ncbi:hypothetical protein EVC08_036 [Rhizobium phage RHph_N65]|nr:hypothetical protein EVC08_036 [Rhizobium phage RHph_N65]
MAYTLGSYSLLSNAAATGSAVSWPGGRGVFSVYAGTFSGATVKLQWSPDDGTTWLDVDNTGDTFVTLTAAGSGLFELPACSIRAFISGGPPSGIYAVAKSVKA